MLLQLFTASVLSFHSALNVCLLLPGLNLDQGTHLFVCLSSTLFPAPSVWSITEHAVNTYRNNGLTKVWENNGRLSVCLISTCFTSCMSLHLFPQLQWLATDVGLKVTSTHLSYFPHSTENAETPLTPHMHTKVALPFLFSNSDLHV